MNHLVQVALGLLTPEQLSFGVPGQLSHVNPSRGSGIGDRAESLPQCAGDQDWPFPSHDSLWLPNTAVDQAIFFTAATFLGETTALLSVTADAVCPNAW